MLNAMEINYNTICMTIIIVVREHLPMPYTNSILRTHANTYSTTDHVNDIALLCLVYLTLINVHTNTKTLHYTIRITYLMGLKINA